MVYFVLELIYLIKRSTKLWINYFEYKAFKAPREFTFPQRHQGKLKFIHRNVKNNNKRNETRNENNDLHQQLIP